ncbi:MAG TPA: hypothetical protein VGN12_06030 [Pirellulales bacterium]
MGVSHRHANVAMPGELTGMGQRNAAVDESAHMAVAPGRMEVGDPFRGLVLDAGSFEVGLDHPPGLLALQTRKQRFARRQRGQPFVQQRQ